MTTCYKLLRSDLTAYGRYQYTPGVTARVEYTGQLCSPGVLHVYDTPEDAVFFDPIHAMYLPIGALWECEYEGPSVSDGTKRGVGELTLVRQTPVPTLSTDVRIERAIRVALELCRDDEWRDWALRWLDGSDRSAYAAESARVATRAEAWQAARAEAWQEAQSAAMRAAAAAAARAAAEQVTGPAQLWPARSARSARSAAWAVVLAAGLL